MQPEVESVKTMKSLITDILYLNTAYDCMPVNSMICSAEKSMPLFDAINILISENVEEILVWDEDEAKWIWMLTIVDIIRLIMHSLRVFKIRKSIDFCEFEQAACLRDPRYSLSSKSIDENIESKMGRMVDQAEEKPVRPQLPTLPKFTHQEILELIAKLKEKKIQDVIEEIHFSSQQSNPKPAPEDKTQQQEPDYNSGFSTFHRLEEKSTIQIGANKEGNPIQRRQYIRLKSVLKESKLSFVIITMMAEKIHRILIEDSESRMDILLYLLRIANESQGNICSLITVQDLLRERKCANLQISHRCTLWEGFELLTEIHRSLWINVVDDDGRFIGMFFREDFRDLFKDWQLTCLWISLGEFIKLKGSNVGPIPEYRIFNLKESTKDIIWKIVMTRRNAIVALDENGRVQTTIGLMELFGMYIQ